MVRVPLGVREKPMHILVLLTLGGAQLDKNLIGWGGGRNVEFHYYDWSFYSQRRNCLLSSSLLRQKSDFRCSDFTYGVKKDHNVKNQNINYLWRITYGYQGL